MLIWTGMLGAVYAFIDEKHLSLIFLRNKLNKKWQGATIIFSYIMTLLFSVLILLWGGIRLSLSTVNQLSPIMKLPMGIVYSIIPISGFLITLITIFNVYIRIKQLKGGN